MRPSNDRPPLFFCTPLLRECFEIAFGPGEFTFPTRFSHEHRHRHPVQVFREFTTLGFLKGHVIVVAHTERGGKIRIISDSEVIKWFKSRGRGYQTKINDLLRDYMNAHGRR